MTLPPNCPLCGTLNQESRVVAHHVYGDEEGTRAFFKCEACDINYLYPQLTPQQEKEFYAKEFENFMASRSGKSAGWEGPEKHIKANENQFKRRWNYLKDHLPKAGSVLELGCSSGFMLYPLKERGYDCYGVEPSGCFSDYVKGKGIPLFVDPTEANQLFDVIMHYFVLEHVRDPLEFLNSNLKVLKQGGKLIVEIPNAADPLYTIYNVPEFEKFYWSIAHHWYFTEKSLAFVLNKINNISYKILRDQRYDLSNHMVWARDGKPGGMNRFIQKLGTELEETYKKSLVQTGYCDTLIAIIEKK